MAEKYRIGVLAAQGAFEEHISHISKASHEGILITQSSQLKNIDALILPGGESTAIGLMLKTSDLAEHIKREIQSGLPVWGTCAGMILLAKNIDNESTTHLGLMNISVKRNAYGRQLGSFKCLHLIPEISSSPTPLVFIRAPYITKCSNSVTVLSKYDNNIIAARENNMLVTSYHPELTSDLSTLKYFVDMIKKSPYKK